MAEVAAVMGATFPYLYDEAQDVAKAYHAACTPDFFLFGADRRLAYRGQLDGARPGNDVPVSGHDLRAALDAVLSDKPAPEPQLPSLWLQHQVEAGQRARLRRAGTCGSWLVGGGRHADPAAHVTATAPEPPTIRSSCG